MCNDRLQELRIKRDAIEEALGSGNSYIELEVRGRRVKMQASVGVLEYLTLEIEKLERLALVRTGAARNKVRLGRA